MKTIEIKMPTDCNYMGELAAATLLKQVLPTEGHYILSKELTGCGGTTMFIGDDEDVIILSPRRKMIENKCDQKHQFKYGLYPVEKYHKDTSKDKDGNITVTVSDKKFTPEDVVKCINGIKTESNDCKANNAARKFICCYDSLRTIVDALGDEARKIRVVVDEYQLFLSDAGFKSRTLEDLLHLLKEFKTVIYMSATDISRKHRRKIDAFKNIDVYKLVWQNKRNVRCYTYETRSIPETLRGIIRDYLDKKFPPHPDENWIKSKEAVFFISNVKYITKAIKDMELTSDQVNVLCAETDKNKRELSKVGCKIGKIPLKGELHKMFTFCTSTVYFGCDFYSTCASTYIFSDPNINTLAVDIILDYKQIIGRQRNIDNKFRNIATIYYKTSTNRIIEDDYYKEIAERASYTERLLRNTVEDRNKTLGLIVDGDSKQNRVNKGTYLYYSTAEQDYKVNQLEIVNDERCYEIYSEVYKDAESFVVALADNTSDTDITSITTEEARKVLEATVKGIIAQFESSSSYENKMYLYCEMIPDNVRNSNLIINSIPPEYIEAYRRLGKDFIKKCSYNCTRIKQEIAKLNNSENIKEAIQKTYFVVKQTYSLKEVKEKLQDIYNQLGITKKVTSNTVKEYCKVVEKTIRVKGIKTRAIEIVGYC